jgi:DNA-binding XRE family transcriptional regulator
MNSLEIFSAPDNSGFRAVSFWIHPAFFHPECAMFPFCDRRVSVPRKDVAPVWNRSFPISKEPTTVGEHLKKKRFGAGIRQSKAAQILEVSARSLSLWECDWLFPTAPYHDRIIKYLGYDPFKILTK